MDNMLRGGGGGSMNYRPSPRRQDYYGSSSRNTRTRSIGPRSMSNNWDVGEDENMSINSYESVNKPLGYPPSNSFDRSRNYGGDYRPSSRWLEEQGSRDYYRNIGPNVRSSSQLDGHPSYYGHVSQFENQDRYNIEMPRDLVQPRQHPHKFSNSRVLEGIDEFDQDQFPKQYYSPLRQEVGFTGIRERPVFYRRESQRWPSNGNFDMDGLRNKKPRKLVSPIAGAAPIVICSNCSILMVLPRRLRIIKNSRGQIRCGSCAAAMLIEVDVTRIRVSTIVKENEYFPVIGHAGPTDDSAAASINDPTEAIKLKCKALIASAVGFSSHGYTDEHLIEKEEIADVAADESRTLNLILNKEISTAMSELEVSHVEYPVTGFSQDSVEVIKEDDRSLRPKERNRPIFVGINEGDTEEKPRSTRNESFDSVGDNDEISEDHQPKVMVNGHPIPDFAVKNAEIMAGPVLPGNYWYDYTAGFWGVMNYPCLGIIPPLIEEFNYMMPERCAAGNTGVFVNGRELHQRDLDLLASRGLPTTKYKSYTVHISGKVFDERTGEELCEYDLGKLAPSVENAKRGFGMRVPNGVS